MEVGVRIFPNVEKDHHRAEKDHHGVEKNHHRMMWQKSIFASSFSKSPYAPEFTGHKLAEYHALPPHPSGPSKHSSNLERSERVYSWYQATATASLQQVSVRQRRKLRSEDSLQGEEKFVQRRQNTLYPKKKKCENDADRVDPNIHPQTK
eukprot:jgi/Psemu1/38091/gm1.38091_g